MTATETLRQLLDERGVEWWPMHDVESGYREDRDTEFIVHGCKHVAHEWGRGLQVDMLTPEQAIEATLGPAVPPPEPPVVPYDLLIDELRDTWGIEACWDGLRKFWYLGWTDEYVEDMGRLHDELCDAVAEASTVKAHRILDRARYAGRGTCKWEPADFITEGEWWNTSCGESFTWEPDGTPNYCPNCGRKVEQ